ALLHRHAGHSCCSDDGASSNGIADLPNLRRRFASQLCSSCDACSSNLLDTGRDRRTCDGHASLEQPADEPDACRSWFNPFDVCSSEFDFELLDAARCDFKLSTSSSDLSCHADPKH